MPRIVQLEREAEQTRADLAHTLDALRDRMSPGQMLDQVIDYASEGEAAEMFGNLRRQVVGNPLPLGLIGIGLGWLMFSGANHSGEHAGREWDRAQSTAAGLSEKAKPQAEDMKSGLASARDRVAGRANQAADSFRQTRDEIGAKASEITQRAKDSVSSASHGLRSAGENFLSTCREQPLILAGLGLALGAALGAALPRTEQEDRLMGEKSDQLKDKIQETASEQVEAVKTGAEQQMDRAKDFAAEKAGEMQDALSQAGAQMTGDAAKPNEESIVLRPDASSDVGAEREEH